jgi:MarR family transcriptional regulator, lower aerobic nicotinate degradation pathway regulator
MGANTKAAPPTLPGTARPGTTRDVLDAIRRIVQTLRESSRLAERRAGLSGAQLFVLHKLAENPRSSVNELAAHTHTHQSSVSAVVTRLVEQGLVQRAPSDSDGRRVELTLSAHGRRVAARMPDPAQARLVASIEQLAPARRRQLAAALSEVANTLTGDDGAPAMFFEERRGRRRERQQ